jgi:hypothetical protein
MTRMKRTTTAVGGNMTRNVYAPGLMVLLFAICLTSIASAQTSWWRTHGGTNDDEGNSVQQTADGGYIVSGFTYSYGAGYSDVYLIKTDAQGDTLWTRTYGGPHDDAGLSVQQTVDGGYIVSGHTYSFGPGTPDYDNVYLIKTNASGDTLWTRVYGEASHDEGNSIQQTTDGGYIIAGWTQSFGAGREDVYLIKTDTLGDTLWTRTFGGAGDDEGYSAQQTTDGGYIIGGFTSSYGAGGYDFYLVKTNSSGETLWTRTYGGTKEDLGRSVQQTADGGYIITGNTESFGAVNGDVYLVQTNATGDTLWTRAYGGTDDDHGRSVRQTTDGGYIIAGFTDSFGAGDGDVYLIRTNAQGDTLWTRAYGGSDYEYPFSVQQSTDGGYIITGLTVSFGAGEGDVYLIKTDADGVAITEEPLTRRPAKPTRLLVRPNPFTSFARVPGRETDVFVLSDVTGRQVATCNGDRVGEGLRPGVYFLSSVGGRAGNAATATIVKTAF